MILGSVHSNGDAIVPLQLRVSDARTIVISAIINTGFNDWLTLPRDIIESLSLPFREEGFYSLADGSETLANFFGAEIEWFDQVRRVLVIEMEGPSLLGMAMLRGARLSIEVIDGGRVEIHQL